MAKKKKASLWSGLPTIILVGTRWLFEQAVTEWGSQMVQNAVQPVWKETIEFFFSNLHIILIFLFVLTYILIALYNWFEWGKSIDRSQFILAVYALFAILVLAISLIIGSKNLGDSASPPSTPEPPVTVPSPTHTPSPTPTLTPTVTFTPSVTPYATDTFSSLLLGGAMWRQLNQCGADDFRSDNDGTVRFLLEAEGTDQCWLEARLPIDTARVLLDLEIVASNSFRGYAGILTSCGNTGIGLQINEKSIDFARDNNANVVYARDDFLNKNIRLSIEWREEVVLLAAYDIDNAEQINPIVGFNVERPCTANPKYIWIGGQAIEGEFDVLLDYAELAGNEQ